MKTLRLRDIIARSPLALLAVTLVAGCQGVDLTPTASGPDEDVYVVADSSSWNGIVGDALRSEIGGFVQTLPTPERAYKLIHRPLITERDLRDLKKKKNVIFVGALSDSSTESTFLRGAFSAEALAAVRNGGGAVVPRDDPWRRYQKVFYVAAETPELVAETIEQNGQDMLDALNEVSRTRLHKDMFEKARQFDIEEKILDEHGFRVQIQHDYQIAIDTTDFIWLRRIISSDSWRSLFVYYIDGADPSHISADWVIAKRDSLARLYLQGNAGGWVEVDQRRPMEFKTIDFLDRYGLETRGLWQMVGPDESGDRVVQYGAGGPFLSYTFYDQDSGRIYIIDGMVFAPGFSKRDFLRQLEVIAYTFKSKREAQKSETANATAALVMGAVR